MPDGQTKKAESSVQLMEENCDLEEGDIVRRGLPLIDLVGVSSASVIEKSCEFFDGTFETREGGKAFGLPLPGCQIDLSCKPEKSSFDRYKLGPIDPYEEGDVSVESRLFERCLDFFMKNTAPAGPPEMVKQLKQMCEFLFRDCRGPEVLTRKQVSALASGPFNSMYEAYLADGGDKQLLEQARLFDEGCRMVAYRFGLIHEYCSEMLKMNPSLGIRIGFIWHFDNGAKGHFRSRLELGVGSDVHSDQLLDMVRNGAKQRYIEKCCGGAEWMRKLPATVCDFVELLQPSAWQLIKSNMPASLPEAREFFTFVRTVVLTHSRHAECSHVLSEWSKLPAVRWYCSNWKRLGDDANSRQYWMGLFNFGVDKCLRTNPLLLAALKPKMAINSVASLLALDEIEENLDCGYDFGREVGEDNPALALLKSVRSRDDEPLAEPFIAGGSFRGYRIVPLRTRRQLRSEGRAMEHCAGSYCWKVRTRICSVYSVRREGARIATFSIKRRFPGSLHVHELSGHRNAKVASYTRRLIHDWVSENQPINSAEGSFGEECKRGELPPDLPGERPYHTRRR